MGEKVVLCSFLHAHTWDSSHASPNWADTDLRQKWTLPIPLGFARLSVAQGTLQAYHSLAE